MKRPCSFIAVLLILLPSSCCNAAEINADLYVSTQGSDDWSGRLSEPNKQQTDGPFATLARAKNAVRELRKQNSSGDVVVLIRGGTYRLKQTVVFEVQDGGPPDSKTTYAATPGETPVFTSGRVITDWEPLEIKPAGLPEHAFGQVKVADISGQFHALFDAEGLLPRARSAGFIPPKDGSRNELYFPRGRLKNWQNIENVELVVRPHHAWIVNILPLSLVDEQRRLATTSIAATYAMKRLHFLDQTESCWVENALEGLDEPGEWVLNSKEGKLYLWPRSDSLVFAPQLTELIRIEGEIDKDGPEDKPVRNLRFRGLAFMHGDRYQIAADDAGLQHDWEMHDKSSSLVRLRIISGCMASFFGKGGRELSRTIRRHELMDLPQRPQRSDVLPYLHTHDNVIECNEIHHAMEMLGDGNAIYIRSAGAGNIIRRNYIHHLVAPMIMQAAIRTDGVDTHSVAVDPLFVDPANGDFRMNPDSPALKMGFVPFDISKVGITNNDG